LLHIIVAALQGGPKMSTINNPSYKVA